LCDALVVVLSRPSSSGVVLSRRAFIGGTLRRGKYRTFVSRKPTADGSIEDVAVLQITDVLLAHDALERVLSIVASRGVPFTALFDTDRLTTGLSDLPTRSFVTGAAWNATDGFSFTLAPM
jgi:hypothetical protein